MNLSIFKLLRNSLGNKHSPLTSHVQALFTHRSHCDGTFTETPFRKRRGKSYDRSVRFWSSVRFRWQWTLENKFQCTALKDGNFVTNYVLNLYLPGLIQLFTNLWSSVYLPRQIQGCTLFSVLLTTPSFML